jgi:hypothetical protein
MGLKSHHMDAKTPVRGKERSKDCTRERGGCFTRGNLTGLDPGGLCLFHHEVGLGWPMTSPRSPMTSSSVLGCFGDSCVPSGRFLRPKKA